jgi:dephospho-CoA kinase
LGEIVFSDKKSLTKLEEVLHPLVREKWQSLMLEDRNADWMMEIPLLYEKKLDVYFDKVICVVVHPQLQEQRLKKRGLSDKDIKARIDNQMNIEEKLKRAHLVISSSGSLPALNEQITEVQSLLL